MDKTYLIKWIGPLSIDEIKEIEDKDSIPFNLYLIYGLKKYAKNKGHYYIGETIQQTVYQRLSNQNHHINDYSKIKEIWIGQFSNVESTDVDVRLVEKMLTSYLGYDPEIGRDSMLNRTNFYAPDTNVYIINRWYDAKENEWQRNPLNSPARVIADVIAYKCNIQGKCIMYEAKKLKKKW